jgi:hypothetical protein
MHSARSHARGDNLKNIQSGRDSVDSVSSPWRRCSLMMAAPSGLPCPISGSESRGAASSEALTDLSCVLPQHARRALRVLSTPVIRDAQGCPTAPAPPAPPPSVVYQRTRCVSAASTCTQGSQTSQSRQGSCPSHQPILPSRCQLTEEPSEESRPDRRTQAPRPVWQEGRRATASGRAAQRPARL